MMNLIRLLRETAGVTQQELAALAGTSQPTIAAYESGKKSPTLRTIENLAQATGLNLIVTYIPAFTREDERSLAYHRAIAELLRKDPATVINHARCNLSKLSQTHRGARSLFRRWEKWLELNTDELIAKMLDFELEAREMRQASPFSGPLSPADRIRILRQFQTDYKP